MSCPVMGMTGGKTKSALAEKGSTNNDLVESVTKLLPDCDRPFEVLKDCYNKVKSAGTGDCLPQSQCATGCLRARQSALKKIGTACANGQLDMHKSMAMILRTCEEVNADNPAACTLQLQKYLTCATEAVKVES